MDESGCSLSISSLLCQEDRTDLDLVFDSNSDEDELYRTFFLLKDTVVSDEEDYIEKLVSREISFERQDHEFSSSYDGSSTEDWFRRARSDAIKWILKNRACFGFGFQTAYLAVTYFDRFFARRRIDNGKSWAFGLVSMACLSVAAKMEECRMPALPEFQVDGCAFHSNVVQRMELLLLDTLQWRMNCVTPFDYLSYFRSKFQCDAGPEESLYKAIEFIFVAINVLNLATYRSSTIAAAAILAASSELYTKELLETKMSNVSLFESFPEKGHVFSCYKIMTQDPPRYMRTPKRLASSEASENYSSITDAIDSASFSLSRNKRRRLPLPGNHLD